MDQESVYCQLFGSDISGAECAEEQGQKGCRGCKAKTRKCRKCRTKPVANFESGLCSGCDGEPRARARAPRIPQERGPRKQAAAPNVGTKPLDEVTFNARLEAVTKALGVKVGPAFYSRPQKGEVANPRQCLAYILKEEGYFQNDIRRHLKWAGEGNVYTAHLKIQSCLITGDQKVTRAISKIKRALNWPEEESKAAPEANEILPHLHPRFNWDGQHPFQTTAELTQDEWFSLLLKQAKKVILHNQEVRLVINLKGVAGFSETVLEEYAKDPRIVLLSASRSKGGWTSQHCLVFPTIEEREAFQLTWETDHS